ncbi:MAG: hypothetical protein GC168_02640 [Candidatus Hydrogenedens sp.]|nr:hypothetical protein [Candidatus Hydrogenedens sp.]
MDDNAVATAGHLPRLAYWLGLFAAGFGYVAFVLCRRDTPISGPEDFPLEFWKLLAVGIALYAISANRTLKPFGAPGGTLWNLAGFGIPFFLMLHWEYVGQTFPWLNHSLTPWAFKRMTPASIAVFASGTLLVTFIALYHGRLAWKERILRPYTGSFAALLAAVVLITFVLQRTHYPHIHHWFIGIMFIPWLRFPHPLTLVCLGLSSGLFVEGAARWGMDTLWYPR